MICGEMIEERVRRLRESRMDQRTGRDVKRDGYNDEDCFDNINAVKRVLECCDKVVNMW